MHPYPSRAFQWYQEHNKRHSGLGDINVTNQTIKFPNKLALQIDISSMCKDIVNLVHSNDVWVKLEGFEIFSLVAKTTRLQCKWSQEQHMLLGNIQPNCPFLFESSRQQRGIIMLRTPSMGDHDFIIDIIKGIQPQEPRWLPCIQQIASIIIISNTSQERKADSNG